MSADELAAENLRLRSALRAIADRATVDAGEGRRFCWSCRQYSEDVWFHRYRGPASFAPSCALATEALASLKCPDQPEKV